jgi:hypothetical protein
MGFSVKLQPLSQIQQGIIQNQTQAGPLEQLGETLSGIYGQ